MRTTLSLDEDLTAELRRIQAETGKTWKQVVNDLVRLGVGAYRSEHRKEQPVRRTRGVRLGVPKIGDISNVHEVLSVAEGDGRR